MARQGYCWLMALSRKRTRCTQEIASPATSIAQQVPSSSADMCNQQECGVRCSVSAVAGLLYPIHTA